MNPPAASPDAQPSPGRNSHRVMLSVALLGVFAGAVYVALFRGKPIDWALFLRTFSTVNIPLSLAGLLVVMLTYAGGALRWQVMLNPIKRDSSFRRILVATIIGFTAVVLFGRAGELVRPYLIATKERVPFTSQVAAWF